MKQVDIIGIGALNYDRLYAVGKIALGGGEESAGAPTEAPGGSAANTIAGLSRLGIRTGLIGTVGRDKEGDFILADLKKEKVDTSCVRMAEGQTGAIIGFVDGSGERALYAYPGVNDSLNITKKCERYARSARYVHLSSFVGGDALKAQKKILKVKGPKISFAPGALYAKKFRSIKPLIKRSSILFLNREEAELMTKKGYRDAATELAKVGADIVAVTLGNKGCYVLDESGNYSVKAYKSRAIDTTGAGDAFAAGFLHGILSGKDIKICAKMGNWAASRCVSRNGAREGLPYKRDLKATF